MIKIEEIYNATNDGLDIILYYYPQATECVGKNKGFKIRDESTASARIKLMKESKTGNLIYKVTDFGDDSHAKSPIDVVMKEENLTFTEALFTLAARYGVGNVLSESKNKPEIRQRKPTEEEKEGSFNIEYNDSFQPWELEVWGENVKPEHLKELNYFSVSWYSKTKKNKENGELETTIISSNENYPIFARVKKDFIKVYQPYNFKKEFRFFYNGNLPKDFVNGLDELEKKCNEYNNRERAIHESDTNNEGKPYKDQKLDCAIICSGERDSVNAAAFGYSPLWLNSETATLDKFTFAKIQKYAHKVYNIPDIDETGIRKGIELGLQHIEILNVRLPKWLQNFKDNRGKARKDLRDFVELRPSKYDFDNLLKTAMPYRFWDTEITPKGPRLEIVSTSMLNFLKDVGFGKLQDPETKEEILIKVEKNIVRKVTSKDIRAFLINFVKHNTTDLKVWNLAINSNRTKTVTMDDLPIVEIDFKDYEEDTQFLFLLNRTLEIKADEIKEIKPADIKRFVWENEVLPHNFKRTEPAFTTTRLEHELYDIEIKNIDSHYFRYLINSSRLYWREEFENRLSADQEENEIYKSANKFSIDGSRLSKEEIQEQKQNLLAKMFSIGYLCHTYKDMSKSWACWIMEDKISADGISSGRSGKSFMAEFLRKFLNNVRLGGRNNKLTENQHVLENVSKYTDLLLVDDAAQYIDFNYFYDIISGGVTVNGKHVKSASLAYEDSPKLAFTSNFAPRNMDASTASRLLFVVFSDWYHEATIDNDYKETRKIIDDFGYIICRNKYKEEYWNQDINFLAECIQFYLQTCKYNEKLQPPMTKVLDRMNIQTMGNQFIEWADVYFSETGTNVNIELIKDDVFNDFKLATQAKNANSHSFTKSLKAFAKYTDYVVSLCPDELINDKKKNRIIRNIGGKTKEIIYLQTTGAPINAHKPEADF